MIYSRFLFLLAMEADGEKRRVFPTTRSVISEYVRGACRGLNCDVVDLGAGTGYLLLLVDLDTRISLMDFVIKLKARTSVWITKMDQPAGDNPCYWTQDVWARAVSPEDKMAMCKFVDSSISGNETFEDVIKRCHLEPFSNMATTPETLRNTFPHHIILIASSSRMLLPIKYKSQLADITRAVADTIGLKVVACSASRNHMHILGHIPVDTSIDSTVNALKSHLLEAMHDNPHFRKFDGWSDDALTFSVSLVKVDKEEHDVLNQDTIHSRRYPENEMSFLYRRLGIRYVASLH